MFYVIFAILAGVTIVITRILNSLLAERIGTFQSTFYNYIVGIVFAIIFFLLNIHSLKGLTVADFSTLPSWAYTGGLLGVIVIVLQNYMTPKTSAFSLTLLMFIGQLFIGIAIDYLTLNVLSVGKIIGGILILAGFTYNLSIDRKKEESLPYSD